jgi:hypothetical protein
MASPAPPPAGVKCFCGDAAESKQPCKNACDHRAGQTPSFWCKLYHAGTEPLLTVQIKATLRDKSDIPRLLPNYHPRALQMPDKPARGFRGLSREIPDRRDAERTFAAPRLRDRHKDPSALRPAFVAILTIVYPQRNATYFDGGVFSCVQAISISRYGAKQT